jgi:hypothetical protein
MPEHEAAALLGTSHFHVLIGREELGFAEVSPLSSEVDPESGEQFALSAPLSHQFVTAS